MALKVKAVERKVKFSKTDPGVWRYVMQSHTRNLSGWPRGETKIILKIRRKSRKCFPN